MIEEHLKAGLQPQGVGWRLWKAGSYGVIMYEIPGAKYSTGNTDHCTQSIADSSQIKFQDKIVYSLWLCYQCLTALYGLLELLSMGS